MLKGSNKLVLSHDTMIQALQYWITNSILRHDQYAPTVVVVEQNKDGTFDVHLEDSNR